MQKFLESFSLAGRVVLLTGGAGEYGTQFATALAESGADIVLTSRVAERAEEVARPLRDHGARAFAESLNLGDPRSIDGLVKRVIEQHGRIDVLVNNAVHRQGGGLFETSAADWDATSAVNSRGLFLMTSAVGRHMSGRGSGSIVNIASIHGVVAPDFSVYDGLDMTSPAFYSYDKGGMINFSRYVASSLGPLGVRSNCICPGGFDPGPGLSSHHQVFVDRYVARTPQRRLASGHDVSGAVVFLASDASSYVNGATLAVDGGWTAI